VSSGVENCLGRPRGRGFKWQAKAAMTRTVRRVNEYSTNRTKVLFAVENYLLWSIELYTINQTLHSRNDPAAERIILVELCKLFTQESQQQIPPSTNIVRAIKAAE